MRISIRQKRVHKKILILIAISGVLLFLFANKNFQALLMLKREIAQLRERIEGLKQANKELEEELEAVKNDPEYFESQARKELGLIKPGERKYKFIESPEEEK